MRRLPTLVIFSLIAAGLSAQDPTPAAQAAAPAQPAQPAPAAQAAAPPPAPSGENFATGWFEVGYRWVSDVAGSFPTYRSIVNLGSGPKLLGTEFTLTDRNHRLFNQAHVRAYSWGDEPGETVHFDATKNNWYRLDADYRDIAYFNQLPSYADPLASRGITLDQQSFDMRRHLGSYKLDLLPNNWLIPYLAFERDSGSGLGVDTFVSLPNEFPVPNTVYDLTNLYRGGVRIERRKFHVTLEQGGTTFVSNENQYQSGTVNNGDNLVPYFGQNISLQSLLAAYGIRGSSVYSKGLLTANVASWLDLYGQFLYSVPSTSVNYFQSDAGNLVLQNQLLFFTGQQYLLSAASKLPHTSASFGGEVRPFKRLRIVENWMTDRMHEDGSANSTSFLLTPGTPTQMAALLESSLVNNYSQEEVNILYDPISKLTLRGGYRYVWGDAYDATIPAAGLASSDLAKLHRQVALGGLTYRPIQKITISGSAEGASSTGAYFRTSLYNYQKVQAKARYQVTRSLNLSADFSLLNNQDPQPGVKFDYLQHNESLSLLWTPPKQGWDFQGTYTRSTIYSDIGYLAPQTLGSQLSLYRDNAHLASGLFHFKLGRGKGPAPQLMAGGSMLISSGSRPTAYYQPIAKLTVPAGKRVGFFAQWTYFGYGEAFYLYEGFRTHMLTAGLRITPWGS